MTINEENFIEELREFLKERGISIEEDYSHPELIGYTFKGDDVFLDMDTIIEEL